MASGMPPPRKSGGNFQFFLVTKPFHQRTFVLHSGVSPTRQRRFDDLGKSFLKSMILFVTAVGMSSSAKLIKPRGEKFC